MKKKVILFSFILPVLVFALEKEWSLSDAYCGKNAVMEQISLNGFWQISLEDGKQLFSSRKNLSRKDTILRNLSGKEPDPVPEISGAGQKDRLWQKFLIPGVWFDTGWWSSTQYESRMAFDASAPLIRIGDRLKWKSKPLGSYYFAWFRRSFVLPSHFTAGKSSLRFDKFNRQGWVWINGVYAGSQELENSTQFSLPSHLKGGDRVNVLVLVSSAVSGYELQFWAGDQVFKAAKTSKYRGISGDVWLEHRIRKPLLGKIGIVPDWERKQLKLSVSFSPPESGTRLSAEIREANGGKTVLADSVLAYENGGDGRYHAVVSGGKLTPWTPDDPRLYDLILTMRSASGEVLDQTLPQRFGMRGIEIRGRDFYFNGHPVRFRINMPYNAMPYETAKKLFLNCKKRGFNAVEFQAKDSADNGAISETLRAADDCGIFLFFLIPGVNNIIHKWRDGVTRDTWLESVRPLIETARNHPSVVLWSMNMNLLGYPLDQEPRHIASDYLPPKGSYSDTNYQVAKESAELVKKLDPSRPVYHHAGGNYGDVHTSNLYLCFSPVSEKAQWPSVWAEKGNKPFIPIELGMPCDLSYYYSRESVGSGHNHMTEPLYAEYGAMVLGPRAYAMDRKHIPKIVGMRVKGRAYPDGADSYPDMQSYFYTALRSDMIETFIQTQMELSRFIQFWRGYGVSGIGPWYNRSAQFKGHEAYSGKRFPIGNEKTPGYKTQFEYGFYYREETPLFRKYQKWFAPELFYLSGPPENETDESSAFYSGMKIAKSVMWVNDSFTAAKRHCEVRLTDPSGKAIQILQADLKADPGSILKHKFEFDLPEVAARSEWMLSLRIDGSEKDSMKLTLFPKRNRIRPGARKLYLFDPVGRTRTWLRKSGVDFTDYTGGKDAESGILLIGEKALSSDSVPWKTLESSVKNGMNVLIFAQEPNILETRLGLRANLVFTRNVFSEKENPFLRGMQSSDLSAWPGESTFSESKPEVKANIIPHHVWKFGNQQQVSAAPLEKPHFGNFRSWMHTGFDLGETALLEEWYGKGKILYCQFDLAERSQANPAGDLLLENMLASLETPSISAKKVFYSGGKRGKEILKAVGISFTEWKHGMKVGTDSLLIAGDGKRLSPRAAQILRNLGSSDFSGAFRLPAEWKNAVRSGGTLLFLAPNDPAGLLHEFGISVQNFAKSDFFYSPENGIDGVGGGDFFWKDYYELPRVREDSPYAAFPAGKGWIHVLSADPFYYPPEQMFQRRERIRGKLLRITSTLLTNLGARSEHSSLALAAKGRKLTGFDLTGTWDFRTDPPDRGISLKWQGKMPSDTRKLHVPGEWEEQGVTEKNPFFQGNMPYDGYAWYFKSVRIPEEYRNLPLTLEIGAVDDFDWTWLNGTLIGKTGKETKGYWMARRLYPIPADNIRYGEENLIAIRVYDNNNGGGISRAPVRIVVEQKWPAPYWDAGDEKRFDPYTYHRW